MADLSVMNNTGRPGKGGEEGGLADNLNGVTKIRRMNQIFLERTAPPPSIGCVWHYSSNKTGLQYQTLPMNGSGAVLGRKKY